MISLNMSCIYIILAMSMTTSVLFMSLSHPMLLAGSIIIQALMVCLMIWTMMSSSWFSYILFLIFLGGVMVLFIYICSLASNELMDWDSNNFFILLVLILSLCSMDFIATQQLSNPLYFYKMTTLYLSLPTLVSMFYLLMTLIVVVKITNINMGPMRTNKK